MEVLALDDPEVAAWAEEERPLLHLLMGDSVARDSGLRTRNDRDRVFCSARGGATWASLATKLPDILREWSAEAAELEYRRGKAIAWLSGNDVYHRRSLLQSYSDESLRVVADHATAITRRLLEEADDVLVLRPLPRLSGDMIGLNWEHSASFQLERTLLRRLPSEISFVTWGRQLTRKARGKHSFTAGCLHWYEPDRTHLTAAGYRKLADAEQFPGWLMLADAGAE